ncbi:MAG: hypothetical protein M3261_04755 [Thermoproteota archaeon]|nr:hypothetical protein [Thermoproteota archaeon]
MARAKSKQKKGQRANLSKTRKKSSVKKKATAKVRKNDKKKTATRKKTSPRAKAKRAEAAPSPAAFTEIASEEVTSPTPAQEGHELLESTESTGADNSESASIDDNSNTTSS